MAIYIYGLFCPLAKTIRYVGKSTNPRKRLHSHMCGARRGDYDHHTARWLRTLDLAGLVPELVVLHECKSDERWQDVERELIASGAGKGWRLTNSTAGGEGHDFLDPADDARYRANLSRSHIVYSQTPEGRARLVKMISAALEPDALERRNKAIRAVSGTAEYKSKMAVVNREINARPDVKAAKSSAGKAMWREKRQHFMEVYARPETKEKQSARRKASWADPVVGAKLRAIQSSDEVRRKKSEAAKRRATPEYRAMMAEKTRISWEKRRKGI